MRLTDVKEIPQPKQRRADPSELLTVRELADFLRVSPALVYRLVEEGKIACHRIGMGRGAIRVRRQDVDDYLAVCREEPYERRPVPRRPKLKHIKL